MNLLDLVLAKHLDPAPRKVAGTHGGEWHGPCPVCGGKDRFHFWPERPSTGNCTVPGVWGCRVCDKSGDAISFVMFAEGLSFKDACKRLDQKIEPDAYKAARLPKSEQEKERLQIVPNPEFPPTPWMEKNAKLVEHAHQCLLQTPEQLDWLASRGIGEEAVRRFRLGWLPGELIKKTGKVDLWYTRARSAWGIEPEEDTDADGTKYLKKAFKFPAGLTIPRFDSLGGAEVVTSLRIRRPDAHRTPDNLPKLKFMAFKGAPVQPLLIAPPRGFGQFAAPYGMLAMEAELDAILMAEVARSSGINCGVLAICSNTARPSEDVHAALTSAARVLVCLDFDPEGSGGKRYTDKALAKWLNTYSRAQDWPPPQGKDPGEAYALGVNLAAWLAAGLPSSCLPKTLKEQGGGITHEEKPMEHTQCEAPVGALMPPPEITPQQRAQLIELGYRYPEHPDLPLLFELLLQRGVALRYHQEYGFNPHASVQTPMCVVALEQARELLSAVPDLSAAMFSFLGTLPPHFQRGSISPANVLAWITRSQS